MSYGRSICRRFFAAPLGCIVILSARRNTLSGLRICAIRDSAFPNCAFSRNILGLARSRMAWATEPTMERLLELLEFARCELAENPEEQAGYQDLIDFTNDKVIEELIDCVPCS